MRILELSINNLYGSFVICISYFAAVPWLNGNDPMEKILTISIAAYNMESYIRQALDSIVSSGVLEKTEVLVIDDGGSDGTLALAQEYQARYPGSVYAVHKENGGYGSTVNYSIKNARGKYFKILDGDDWFDSSGLRDLVHLLEKLDADLVVTPYYKVCDGKILSSMTFQNVPLNRKLHLSDVGGRATIAMQAITYRTSVLRRSGLTMPEHMLYTDQYYAVIPMAVVDSVYFSDIFVYCYRIARDGQSIAKEARIRHTRETLVICEDIVRFCADKKDNRNYGYLSSRAAGICTRAAKTLLLRPVSRKNLSLLKKFDRRIRKISPDIYRKQYREGKSGLLVMLLHKTGYTAYWALKFLPGGFPNWD